MPPEEDLSFASLALHQENHQLNSDSRAFIIGDDVWNRKTQHELYTLAWAFSWGNSNQNWCVFYWNVCEVEVKAWKDTGSVLMTATPLVFQVSLLYVLKEEAALPQWVELKGTVPKARHIVQQSLPTLSAFFLFNDKVIPKRKWNGNFSSFQTKVKITLTSVLWNKRRAILSHIFFISFSPNQAETLKSR